MINSDTAYSKQDLKNLKPPIGDETLREARQTGIVKAYVVGRANYYLGSELLRWISEQPTRDKE